MARIVCMRAVNVNKRFQAVFLALLHDNVEDFHAVFHVQDGNRQVTAVFHEDPGRLLVRVTSVF